MATAFAASPSRTEAPAEIPVHPPGEGGWLSPAQVAELTPESVREAVAALRPAQVAEDFDRILRSLADTGAPHAASVAR